MRLLPLFCPLAALAAGCVARSEYEKRHFTIDTYEIESEKLARDRKFVFLSDLHNNEFGTANERLLRAVDLLAPDGILIGGDMMVSKGRQDMEPALRLVKALAYKYPVWCANGNHETRMRSQRKNYGDGYWRYRDALIKSGVNYLSDSAYNLDGDIAITGFDLACRYYEKWKPAKLTAAHIRDKVGDPAPGRFQILLAHSPLFFDAYSQWGADLTLAGHFHGGTIRIPGLGGVMTPQFQFFLPCCAGSFESGGRRMIVSRGLGTHSINIRLNNRPQIVVVALKTKG